MLLFHHRWVACVRNRRGPSRGSRMVRLCSLSQLGRRRAAYSASASTPLRAASVPRLRHHHSRAWNWFGVMAPSVPVVRNVCRFVLMAAAAYTSPLLFFHGRRRCVPTLGVFWYVPYSIYFSRWKLKLVCYPHCVPMNDALNGWPGGIGPLWCIRLGRLILFQLFSAFCGIDQWSRGVPCYMFLRLSAHPPIFL